MAEVREIGVVGAGFMGSGIAESAARAGLRVRVYEPAAGPLEQSRTRIARSVERAVRGGKMDSEQAQELQERGLPFDAPEQTAEVMERQRRNVPAMDDYPYLVEAATELAKAGYDYDAEFAFGLELILDGIERLRRASASKR